MPSPIIFPSGSSCEIYSFGYTFGCTNDAGITRDIEHQWFFDEDTQAWISISDSGKYPDSEQETATNVNPIFEMSLIDNFEVVPEYNFNPDVQFVSGEIKFKDPPETGKYAECKFLCRHSPAQSAFFSGSYNFTGLDINGDSSTVHLDPDINLVNQSTGKLYSFTVFTHDGGLNYWVHSNGSTLGWSIS